MSSRSEAFKIYNNNDMYMKVKEKDGDDDNTEMFTDSLLIERAENGWMLSTEDEEENKTYHVYQMKDGKEMIKVIADCLGVKL